MGAVRFDFREPWTVRLLDPGPHASMSSAGVLVLRLGFFAVLAATHGAANARGLAAGPVEFPDPLGLGPTTSLVLVTFAELVCGMLVAVGLFTRVAAGIVAFNFAIAFFLFHASDPFARGELAFHYLVAAAALVMIGPGRWSVDARLRARCSLARGSSTGSDTWSQPAPETRT